MTQDSGLGTQDLENLPLVWDAFEGVGTTTRHVDPGSGDQVFHGSRHEDLGRAGERRDAGCDVDGEAGDVVVEDLDLAGVQPASNLDAEWVHRRRERGAETDGLCRAVEGGEEPVSGRLHFFASPPGQLISDDGVVAVEQVSPPLVAERCRQLGGGDDIGKHYGGDDAVGLGRPPYPGDKLLDLLQHRFGVSRPEQVIGTGKLDQRGVGHLGGDITALFDVYVSIVDPVQE